jgi:hypothetical protein
VHSSRQSHESDKIAVADDTRTHPIGGDPQHRKSSSIHSLKPGTLPGPVLTFQTMLEICLRIATPPGAPPCVPHRPDYWLMDTMHNRRQLIEERDAINRRQGSGCAFIAERPLGSARQLQPERGLRDAHLPAHSAIA